MVNVRQASLTAIGALAAASLAVLTQAQTQLAGFKMPSDNIYCMLDPPYQGHPTSDLRCDMVQTDTRPPPAPASCRFSWGKSFDIDQDGNMGVRLCVSDTTRDDSLPVLAYGASWNHSGISCLSAPSGLTCTNKKGHGFALSREMQKLF